MVDQGAGPGDVAAVSRADEQHAGASPLIHRPMDLGGPTARDRPIPSKKPPFSARRRAVSLDRGRVDGGRGVEAGVALQGLEDIMPDALSASPIEPVVDRRVRTVLRRTIQPARPGPQRENDAESTRRSSTRRAPRRPVGRRGCSRANASSSSQ